MTAATLEGTVGGYKACLTDEGLVIYNVPIFCACAFDAGEPKMLQFNELWVKDAVKKAMRRQRENYRPPMHIRHHDRETAQNDSVRKAGYFRVRGTGPITLDGKRRTAVYADLVFTDANAQWEVRTNQLNYRSVEIFDYTAEPSIDGLALLDHEAPHLELPMLQIDGPVEDVRDDQTPASANFQSLTPPKGRGSLVCFRRAGDTAFVTFEDQSMTPTDTEAEEAIEAARIANFTADDDKDANMSDDDKDANMSDDDKEADMEEGDGGGIDWAAVAKALASGEVMQKDLDMVLEALQNQQAAEEPVTQEEKVEEPALAAAPMSAQKKSLVTMAKLQGKVDALEARDQARVAKDLRVNDVAKALTRLKGLPLGADLQGKLVSFHRAHGGAAFGDYVESLAQNTAIEPGDREDMTAAAFQALGGKVPAIAMKYQTHGVDAVERASKYCREYQELQETNARMSVSEEAYVENNMKRAL